MEIVCIILFFIVINWILFMVEIMINMFIKIIKFFNFFYCCNIQFYIVFDGGNDLNDMKFQISYKRMKQRFEMVM